MEGSARLAGKRALITGGASGIGRAIAALFAAEGAMVAIADINREAAEQVAHDIRVLGGETLAWGCDVSASDDALAAVRATMTAFGGLEIVVSGAAIFTPSAPLHALTEAQWQQTLAVNLSGAFHICKHALPHLQAGGGGNVILIASQMARVANAGQAAYCATKGALVQLAKGMALDYANDRIRVNTLSPGAVVTNRVIERHGDIESAQREWGPKHPLGRLAEPEEIARGALFLASEDSAFMTGADLLMDGGYTAW